MRDAQFVRFVITGGSVAALFFVMSYVLVRYGLSPFAGSVIAYLIAFACGYTLQRNWTFSGTQAHRVAFPRYLTLQLCCALLSGVVSHVAVERFGASPVVMSLTTTIVASAVSYVLSSRWVFAVKP